FKSGLRYARLTLLAAFAAAPKARSVSPGGRPPGTPGRPLPGNPDRRKRKALPRGCHRCEAQDHPGLPGVQAPQLHHQEEPAQRPGPARADEVLPELPLPPAAPRDPLATVGINTDYLGRTFPATEPYEVSRVKIADFAEAIGDRNPLYTDAA